MRAFEIHIYRNGVWKLDSIFDNRELALYAARRADDTNRYAGTLVVEETSYEATEKVDRRVIARSGRADIEARARRAASGYKPGPSRRPATTGREPVRRSKAPSPRPRKDQTPLVTLLLVLFLLVAGFAGIVALSQMSA